MMHNSKLLFLVFMLCNCCILMARNITESLYQVTEQMTSYIYLIEIEKVMFYLPGLPDAQQAVGGLSSAAAAVHARGQLVRGPGRLPQHLHQAGGRVAPRVTRVMIRTLQVLNSSHPLWSLLQQNSQPQPHSHRYRHSHRQPRLLQVHVSRVSRLILPRVHRRPLGPRAS